MKKQENNIEKKTKEAFAFWQRISENGRISAINKD